MNCSNCGNPHYEGYFCNYCGQQLISRPVDSNQIFSGTTKKTFSTPLALVIAVGASFGLCGFMTVLIGILGNANPNQPPKPAATPTVSRSVEPAANVSILNANSPNSKKARLSTKKKAVKKTPSTNNESNLVLPETGEMADSDVPPAADKQTTAPKRQNSDVAPSTVKRRTLVDESYSDPPPVYVPQSRPRSTSGRTLIRGPRGGCYYINSGGGKTYVDRSMCN